MTIRCFCQFSLRGGRVLAAAALLRRSGLAAEQRRAFAAVMPGGKQTYKRDKPHLNVGTIGHVDHGKTTLTSAITRVLATSKGAKFKRYEDIDNAPEEKQRGITINAFHAEYETPTRHYAHIDCPGHADYIKNMITGTSQMEGAILVVAATDGAMPQTREHLVVAKQMGICKENIAVYINKMDAMRSEDDLETVELVIEEIRELLTEFGFDGENTPFIKGSAICCIEGKEPELGEKSVRELIDALDNKFIMPEREDLKAMDVMVPVEHVYVLPGRGTVATGKLERGTIKKGMKLQAVGYGSKITTQVSGVEMFNKTVDLAEVGDQLGLLLKGVSKADIRRGLVLVPAGSETSVAHDKFKAMVYLLTKQEGGLGTPLASYHHFALFSLTYNLGASCELVGRDVVMPGEHAELIIRMARPVFIARNQQFAMRTKGLTIGTGLVMEVLENQSDDELSGKHLKSLMRKEMERLGFNPYSKDMEKRLQPNYSKAPEHHPAAIHFVKGAAIKS